MLRESEAERANTPIVSVEFTPEFKRNTRTLAKSYRSIRSDIEPFIKQLQAGETPGDHIPRIEYTVYKVRLNNSDTKKGKRGGYRVIYYLKTPDSVILVTIYSKLEQGDISSEAIRYAIEEFGRLP